MRRRENDRQIPWLCGCGGGSSSSASARGTSRQGAAGGEGRQGNGRIFGSIAQQQRTMIHLAPLPWALIGIGWCIGGSWSVILRLGVAVVGLLVLGVCAIAVHD